MAKDKGATGFIVSTDPKSIEAGKKSIDIILNTVSVDHDINVYLPLLRTNGTIVQLGGCIKPHTVGQMPLMFQRLSITGSLIGGIASTQEVVDYCHEKNIYPDIKMITASGLNEAWKDLATSSNAGAVRYVIDIKASL